MLFMQNSVITKQSYAGTAGEAVRRQQRTSSMQQQGKAFRSQADSSFMAAMRRARFADGGAHRGSPLPQTAVDVLCSMQGTNSPMDGAFTT